MAKFEYTSKFDIGETVYSIEGDKGKIIDITHFAKLGIIKYNVIYGRRPDDDIWQFAIELSREKKFS